MGSSGRHRQTHGPTILHTTLIAAAGLVATVAIIAIAITGSGSSSAQTASRAAPGSRELIDQASRDSLRTPLATPSPEPSDTPTDAPKKKRHRTVLFHGTCEASYYGSGATTASGEAFDPDALTAAHKTLPMGSKVRVTNRNNDRSVVVRINDRGPFVPGRCLDLSTAAMHAVGGTGSGVIPVNYEVIRRL